MEVTSKQLEPGKSSTLASVKGSRDSAAAVARELINSSTDIRIPLVEEILIGKAVSSSRSNLGEQQQYFYNFIKNASIQIEPGKVVSKGGQIPDMIREDQQRRDNYLSTLLSNRVSERTNAVSR